MPSPGTRSRCDGPGLSFGRPGGYSSTGSAVSRLIHSSAASGSAGGSAPARFDLAQRDSRAGGLGSAAPGSAALSPAGWSGPALAAAWSGRVTASSAGRGAGGPGPAWASPGGWPAAGPDIAPRASGPFLTAVRSGGPGHSSPTSASVCAVHRSAGPAWAPAASRSQSATASRPATGAQSAGPRAGGADEVSRFPASGPGGSGGPGLPPAGSPAPGSRSTPGTAGPGSTTPGPAGSGAAGPGPAGPSAAGSPPGARSGRAASSPAGPAHPGSSVTSARPGHPGSSAPASGTVQPGPSSAAAGSGQEEPSSSAAAPGQSVASAPASGAAQPGSPSAGLQPGSSPPAHLAGSSGHVVTPSAGADQSRSVICRSWNVTRNPGPSGAAPMTPASTSRPGGRKARAASSAGPSSRTYRTSTASPRRDTRSTMSSVPAGRSVTIQLDRPRVSTVLSRGRPSKNSTPVFSQVRSSARSMTPAWSY